MKEGREKEEFVQSLVSEFQDEVKTG